MLRRITRNEEHAHVHLLVNRVSPLDLIFTPISGFLWGELELWLDRRIARLPPGGERRFWRSLLPSHVFVNLTRGHAPWYRGVP